MTDIIDTTMDMIRSATEEMQRQRKILSYEREMHKVVEQTAHVTVILHTKTVMAMLEMRKPNPDMRIINGYLLASWNALHEERRMHITQTVEEWACQHFQADDATATYDDGDFLPDSEELIVEVTHDGDPNRVLLTRAADGAYEYDLWGKFNISLLD